mmetsp:Transcript_65619/g.182515  ORF Transcript_65619/g.182515 Transcript_65619/m.182515 type:complete len:216 (-) Transcript_65619:174-821(-)
MPDVAAAQMGGQVIMVTSLDENHPGENVLDGTDQSFWISTGLYPQEILLLLGRPSRVSCIKLSSTHVRSVRIEGCREEQPVNFTTLAEDELEDTQGRLQARELRCDEHVPFGFIRVVVLSGWHDFCTIHRICVDGDVIEGKHSPSGGKKESDVRSRRRESRASQHPDLAQTDLEIVIPSQRLQNQNDEPDAPRLPANVSGWQTPSSRVSSKSRHA